MSTWQSWKHRAALYVLLNSLFTSQQCVTLTIRPSTHTAMRTHKHTPTHSNPPPHTRNHTQAEKNTHPSATCSPHQVSACLQGWPSWIRVLTHSCLDLAGISQFPHFPSGFPKQRKSGFRLIMKGGSCFWWGGGMCKCMCVSMYVGW